MYIDFKEYKEFEEKVIGLDGQFISPGGMAKDFGVTRQAVNNWINWDKINAYRYEGKQGYFVFIPLSEYEKIEE